MQRLHEVIMDKVFIEKVLQPLVEDREKLELIRQKSVSINRFFNKVYLKNPLERTLKSLIVGFWKEMPEIKKGLKDMANGISTEDYTDILTNDGNIDYNTFEKKCGIPAKILKLFISKCELKLRDNFYKAIKRSPADFYDFMLTELGDILEREEISVISSVILTDAGINEDEIQDILSRDDVKILDESLVVDKEGKEEINSSILTLRDTSQNEVVVFEPVDEVEVEDIEEGVVVWEPVVEDTETEEIALSTTKLKSKIDFEDLMKAIEGDYDYIVKQLDLVFDAISDYNIEEISEILSAILDFPFDSNLLANKKNLSSAIQYIRSSPNIDETIKRMLFLDILFKENFPNICNGIDKKFFLNVIENCDRPQAMVFLVQYLASLDTEKTQELVRSMDKNRIGIVLSYCETAKEWAGIVWFLSLYSHELARALVNDMPDHIERQLKLCSNLPESIYALWKIHPIDSKLVKSIFSPEYIKRCVNHVQPSMGLETLDRILWHLSDCSKTLAKEFFVNIPKDTLYECIGECRDLKTFGLFIHDIKRFSIEYANELASNMLSKDYSESLYYIMLRSGVDDISYFFNVVKDLGIDLQNIIEAIFGHIKETNDHTVFLKMYLALPQDLKTEFITTYRKVLYEIKTSEEADIVSKPITKDLENLADMTSSEVIDRIKKALEQGVDVGYILTILDNYKDKIAGLHETFTNSVDPGTIGHAITDTSEDFDTVVMYIQVISEIDPDYAHNVVKALDPEKVGTMAHTIPDLFHLIGYLQYFEEYSPEKVKEIINNIPPELFVDRINKCLEVDLITNTMIFLEERIYDQYWRNRFIENLDKDVLLDKIRKGQSHEDMLYIVASIYRFNEKTGIEFASKIGVRTILDKYEYLSIKTMGPILKILVNLDPDKIKDTIRHMGVEHILAVLGTGESWNLRDINDIFEAVVRIDRNLAQTLVSRISPYMLKEWIETDLKNLYEVSHTIRILIDINREMAKEVLMHLSLRKVSKALRNEKDVVVTANIISTFKQIDQEIYDAFVTPDVKKNIRSNILECDDIERMSYAIWSIWNTDTDLIAPITDNMGNLKSRFMECENISKLLNALELIVDIDPKFVRDVLASYGHETIASKLLSTGNIRHTSFMLSRLRKISLTESQKIMEYIGERRIREYLEKEDDIPSISYALYELGLILKDMMRNVLETINWKKIIKRLHTWKNLKEIGFFIVCVHELYPEKAKDLVEALPLEMYILKIKDWNIKADTEYFLNALRLVNEETYRALVANIK